MPRSRWLLLLLLLLGCGAAEPLAVDPVEAGTTGPFAHDASTPDGEPDLGASPEPTPDAAVPMDGGAEPDASPRDAADLGDPDAGILCSAGGLAGECLDVADCQGDQIATPGHCPGPSWVQCCTPVPSDGGSARCDENEHPQPNSGLSEVVYDDCPAGMVGIETFCIDRYEASLLELGPNQTPWSPYFNPAGHQVRAISAAGAIPQGYINELQAAAACAQSSKRLCTTTEWLRACQGPAAETYPYGPSRQPGVCNDARAQHPAVEYFMTTAGWIWSELDNPCLNQLPGGLAPSGAYPSCVSAEGVYDLMGNLHEWVDDPAGTFRGGFYVDTVQNGNGCLYRTTAHDVGHFDYSTGFRCCADR